MKSGVRIIVVLLATAIIGYGSFSAAFVRVVALANPQAALAFDAKDPVALAAMADTLALRGVTAETSPQIYRLAKASLGAQSLNPRALRLLVSVLEPAVTLERQAATLALSQRLSRRDVGTQLLLIEQNVQADDIKSALRHYNYALTTDETSWAILFPILSAAIEDPPINREFSNYIQSAQPWLGAFIRFKLEKDDASNALVTAANTTSVKPGNADFDDLKQYLFEQSVRNGDFSGARAFYNKYRVGAPDLLQSTAFTRVSVDSRSSKLHWQLSELPYILPIIDGEPGASQLGLTVSGSTGARGTVATKLLMLAPASYRIEVDYGDVDFTPSSFATWTLRCTGVKDAPVIWTETFTKADGLRATVSIPDRCEAQTLALSMTASPAMEESVVTVRSVRIKREAP